MGTFAAARVPLQQNIWKVTTQSTNLTNLSVIKKIKRGKKCRNKGMKENLGRGERWKQTYFTSLVHKISEVQMKAACGRLGLGWGRSAELRR